MSKTRTTLVAVQLLHAVNVLQDGKQKALDAGGSVTLPDDVAAELVAAGAARYVAAAAPVAKAEGQGGDKPPPGPGDLLQQGQGGNGS